MSEYQKLMNAARRADAAGDEAAAKRLVQMAIKARDSGENIIGEAHSSPAEVTKPSEEPWTKYQSTLPPGPWVKYQTPMQAALLEKARREKARRLAAKSSTTIAEQAGNGVNEGLAGMLGFPVDAVTSAINGVAGREVISDPVGGSESFEKLLSPFITDAEPQTTAQRHARRIEDQQTTNCSLRQCPDLGVQLNNPELEVKIAISLRNDLTAKTHP